MLRSTLCNSTATDVLVKYCRRWPATHTRSSAAGLACLRDGRPVAAGPAEAFMIDGSADAAAIAAWIDQAATAPIAMLHSNDEASPPDSEVRFVAHALKLIIYLNPPLAVPCAMACPAESAIVIGPIVRCLHCVAMTHSMVTKRNLDGLILAPDDRCRCEAGRAAMAMSGQSRASAAGAPTRTTTCTRPPWLRHPPRCS